MTAAAETEMYRWIERVLRGWWERKREKDRTRERNKYVG